MYSKDQQTLAMVWLLSSTQINVLFTTGSPFSAGVIARACVSLAGPSQQVFFHGKILMTTVGFRFCYRSPG